MDKTAFEIKAAIAGIVAIGTALWGWFGWLVMIWVCAMSLDWLSGSWAGTTKRGGWSSKRAREGIAHKGGMLFVVLCSLALDWLLATALNNIPSIEMPFEYTVFVSTLVLFWYIVTELGSIIENAVVLGAPCPPFLQKILAVMNAKILKVGDKISDSIDENKNKQPPEG